MRYSGQGWTHGNLHKCSVLKGLPTSGHHCHPLPYFTQLLLILSSLNAISSHYLFCQVSFLTFAFIWWSFFVDLLFRESLPLAFPMEKYNCKRAQVVTKLWAGDWVQMKVSAGKAHPHTGRWIASLQRKAGWGSERRGTDEHLMTIPKRVGHMLKCGDCPRAWRFHRRRLGRIVVHNTWMRKKNICHMNYWWGPSVVCLPYFFISSL